MQTLCAHIEYGRYIRLKLQQMRDEGTRICQMVFGCRFRFDFDFRLVDVVATDASGETY